MTGLPVDHRKIFVDWVRNRSVTSLACVSVSCRQFTVLCSFNTPRQIVLESPPGRPAAGHPSSSSQEFLLRLLLLRKGRSVFRRNHHPFQWSRQPLPRSLAFRVNRAIAFLTSIIALHGSGACAFFSRAAAFVRAGVSVFTRSVVFFNELHHSANKRYSAADSNRSLRRVQERVPCRRNDFLR